MAQEHDVVGNSIRKDLERRTIALMNDFSLVGSDNKKKFPEALFKRHYVEFFSGVKSEHDATLLQHWYSIAGSPFEEVDLTDSHGNVVATVPPLLNRDIIPVVTVRQQGADVDFVMETARQQATLSPRLAVTRMATSLNEKFIKPDDATTDQAKLRWDTFMSRYGSNIVTSNSQAKDKPVESDFEYD